MTKSLGGLLIPVGIFTTMLLIMFAGECVNARRLGLRHALAGQADPCNTHHALQSTGTRSYTPAC